MNRIFCDKCNSKRRNKHKKKCELNVTIDNNYSQLTQCSNCQLFIPFSEYSDHLFSHEVDYRERHFENLGNNIIIHPITTSMGINNLGRKRSNFLSDSTFNLPYEVIFPSILNVLLRLTRSINEERQSDSISKEVFNALAKKKISKEDDPIIIDKSKCTICIDEYIIGSKVLTLPCMHNFHESCIKKWFKQNCTCPICKFKIEMNNLN